MEPTRGLEPLTARLQVGCATNCATSAGHGNKSRDKHRDNAGNNSAAASGGRALPRGSPRGGRSLPRSEVPPLRGQGGERGVRIPAGRPMLRGPPGPTTLDPRPPGATHLLGSPVVEPRLALAAGADDVLRLADEVAIIALVQAADPAERPPPATSPSSPPSSPAPTSPASTRSSCTAASPGAPTEVVPPVADRGSSAAGSSLPALQPMLPVWHRRMRRPGASS
jgi:hypothetical protein